MSINGTTTTTTTFTDVVTSAGTSSQYLYNHNPNYMQWSPPKCVIEKKPSPQSFYKEIQLETDEWLKI